MSPYAVFLLYLGAILDSRLNRRVIVLKPREDRRFVAWSVLTGIKPAMGGNPRMTPGTYVQDHMEADAMWITRQFTKVALALVFAMSTGRAMAAEPIAVYKSATCGCCEKWIDHLRKSGFEVRSTDTEAMGAVKARFGVPMKMHSCHTAVVGGYVIEGHVPASDILRLLKERPKVAGLAAPGMPMGSPGMEGPKAERYSVLSFTKDGTSAVFATH